MQESILFVSVNEGRNVSNSFPNSSGNEKLFIPFLQLVCAFETVSEQNETHAHTCKFMFSVRNLLVRVQMETNLQSGLILCFFLLKFTSKRQRGFGIEHNELAFCPKPWGLVSDVEHVCFPFQGFSLCICEGGGCEDHIHNKQIPV